MAVIVNADIDWNVVIGDKTLANGGLVGDLMLVASAHIDEAVRKSRITKEKAGDAYIAMIPAAFQEAMQFALGEQLTEANIDKVRTDTLNATQDNNLKLFQIQTTAWTSVFNSAKVDNIVAQVTTAEITNTYNKIIA